MFTNTSGFGPFAGNPSCCVDQGSDFGGFIPGGFGNPRINNNWNNWAGTPGIEQQMPGIGWNWAGTAPAPSYANPISGYDFGGHGYWGRTSLPFGTFKPYTAFNQYPYGGQIPFGQALPQFQTRYPHALRSNLHVQPGASTFPGHNLSSFGYATGESFVPGLGHLGHNLHLPYVADISCGFPMNLSPLACSGFGRTFGGDIPVSRQFVPFNIAPQQTQWGAGHAGASLTVPAINMWEDEKQLVIEVEVPGVNLDDVDLQINGRTLSIRTGRIVGTRSEDRGRRLICCESTRSGYARTIPLPFDIEADNVDARLVNGVLELTLPKVCAQQRRNIRVNQVAA